MRTLSSSSLRATDPYSPESLARLSTTNLRIRLLKAQSCPAPPRGSAPTPGPGAAPYSIYTLLARGTCLCHGHAEQCVTPSSQGALQGPGVVRRNTPTVCVCVCVCVCVYV